MSRIPFPFHAADISALARTLAGQIAALGRAPTHVELLNMLARSAGWRNFQHFRAQAAARTAIETAESNPAVEAIDFIKVRRLLRHFDAEGRLLRWPAKLGERQICIWVPWSRLPSRQVLSEPQINGHIEAAHTFGDYALLRRWMCDWGMVERTTDGREYRRIERRPPAEARELIAGLARRRSGGAA